MTDLMRRWAIDAIGRNNLALSQAPIPEPKPGELLVRVAAVSLNYRDKLVLESGMGLPLVFPFSPGSDMAGTVAAAGAGATRFKPGERVITNFNAGWLEGKPAGTGRNPPYRSLGGTFPGVLAEYVAFPEDWFVAAPKSLDDAEASTLPITGLTVWTSLIEYGGLQAGQTVLVQGTGGVALFGLQIAKAHGAKVIVTSGSDEKLARAKALGADILINRSKEDWVEAVYRVTADRGVDHILEIVGGANLGQAIRAVAIHGRISVIGVLDGFEVSGPVGPLLMKGLTIQGIQVGHRRGLEDFTRAVEAIGLKPVIDKRYTFEQVPEAFDHLDRGPFGKIVVEVG
ncbi:NAD(P)-dependent alcohol dehydrogenase [Bosea caraganae]|uniref:NAD(P)-dependent alcohol dehydrogenase n=1 Tax=Bosea caraganae TaxID=2763117 RepID=A0A370LAF2_9HYPH|nr:NAD(P)-dependent alcohol dehydrogenase [Bosea caraganae]RDJ21789.1 NAD(P)-dependent alcohol dehydrogenase [Bosea caraganae]RDJ28181.1 NAD(P)-dependent alcohol dehydrogenase [Bosea caraganae]